MTREQVIKGLECRKNAEMRCGNPCEETGNCKYANYKSPIEAFYSDLQLKVEDGVYKAVQAVDIHVDRDELIKALQYDRQQYEKGWHDALLKEQEAIPVKRIDGKRNHFLKCGNCNTDLMSGMKYCPQCGKAVKWDD